MKKKTVELKKELKLRKIKDHKEQKELKKKIMCADYKKNKAI